MIPATEGMPFTAMRGPESRGRLGGANDTGLKVKWQIVVRSATRCRPCYLCGANRCQTMGLPLILSSSPTRVVRCPPAGRSLPANKESGLGRRA